MSPKVSQRFYRAGNRFKTLCNRHYPPFKFCSRHFVTVRNDPVCLFLPEDNGSAERQCCRTGGTPESAVQEIALQGQATEGGFDGAYDPLLILFICLAVIFAAEWGVYCYEKRQLR